MSGMSYGDFKEIPSKNEKASHQTAGGHKVITANEQSVVMLPFLAAHWVSSLKSVTIEYPT